jgi:tripartite-type tricarboxylate transporter receptor subunit TctC
MISFLRPMRSLLVAAALAAAAFVPAHGQQSYPDRPIRILVGFQAGS